MKNSQLGYGLDEDLRKLEKDEPHFCLQILESAIELTGWERDPKEEKVLFEPGSYKPEEEAQREDPKIEKESDIDESNEGIVEEEIKEIPTLPPQDLPDYVELAYNLGLLGFHYARGRSGKREVGVVLISEESSWQLKREFLNGNRIEKIVSGVEKKDVFLRPLFQSFSKDQSLSLEKGIDLEVYFSMVCLGYKYFLIGDERARHNEFKPWMKNMNTFHRDKKDSGAEFDKKKPKLFKERDREAEGSHKKKGERDYSFRKEKKDYADRRKFNKYNDEKGFDKSKKIKKDYDRSDDEKLFKKKKFKKNDSKSDSKYKANWKNFDDERERSYGKKDSLKKGDFKMKGRPSSKKPNDGPSKKGGFRR